MVSLCPFGALMTVYRPIKRNADIDAEVALIQAATALDAAGVVAETTNDVEGLLNVVAMWMKYGEALTNFTEYVESQGATKQVVKEVQTGFQRSVPVEPNITVEENEDD